MESRGPQHGVSSRQLFLQRTKNGSISTSSPSSLDDLTSLNRDANYLTRPTVYSRNLADDDQMPVEPHVLMRNGVIHSKARKSLALIKHPPYLKMISDAVVTLKERNGSSQYAIGKFIQDKHKDLPVNFKKMLLIQLKNLVASHKLVKVKASYKLPSAAKPKPKAAAKPNPAAKKAPAKKKPAAKAKPASKAKPAAKTVTNKAPAKKKPIAKPNPTPKAMPAGDNSKKPVRQRKRSARLITVEEISMHYGKSFEEAVDILGG